MDIFQIYKENANSEQAEKMAAYMKNICPFLGIPKPKRAEISKAFLKEAKKHASIDWDFVDKCWALEREFQYLALEYLHALAKHLSLSDIPRLKNLALQKSWWDTIDSLDKLIGDIALRDAQASQIMLEWSLDDNFWLRRIAINHQLDRKEKTDENRFEQILINQFGQTEFFINKAVGWSLRAYSKTNPDWVRAFLSKHRDKMAPLSIKEASKYI